MIRNVTSLFFKVSGLAMLLIACTGTHLFAQTQQEHIEIVIEPENPELKVGEELPLKAKVINRKGNIQPDSVIFFSRNNRIISITPEGLMKALAPGKTQIFVLKPAQGDNGRLVEHVDVTVPFPALENIRFTEMPEKIYAETSFPLHLEVYDAAGLHREDIKVTEIASSNPQVAEVTGSGEVKAKSAGTFRITASYKNLKQTWEGEVITNPVTDVDLIPDKLTARTGEVIHFSAVPKDKKGNAVEDAPIIFAFTANSVNERGRGAAALIKKDGRFVANQPGLYTIIAKNGHTATESNVQITPRDVRHKIEVVGHGKVLDVRTSDLWVWEGPDGRDYAATGTWGANGDAYFWDVTDPAHMKIIDTVHVDARTVNDIKVNEDGRIAVITREGASDRKNGLVILDITDPYNVKILSRFNDGLTGGVHNVFIYENHVYAVNNGRRYDIINIEDPKNPYRVSRFELDTPGHAVHDVWVADGIAYSSNWDNGVVAVDVGSHLSGELSGAGGSPQNPKMLGKYTYPSGWNHAAFPFKSESTGEFYIVAGDEAFPGGIPAGWIHFFKLDSWDRAEEVARYEVPEAGTHNFWIKNDTLYIAYYQGGLRVVDISGELIGNLYEQGREIARFLPKHPEGFEPNSPMAWGPQPYKGYIFVSDFNTGLWALKLKGSKP